MAARSSILDSFVDAISPLGLLDRFQVAGVTASWWGDIQFDLRALAAGGFGAVIDGWVTTITTALADKSARGNPLDHRLVRALLPEYLDEIEEGEARREELEATIKGATDTSDEDAEDEVDDEDAPSPTELAALRKELNGAKRWTKVLEQEFVGRLVAARTHLSREDEQELVLGIAHLDLAEHLATYVDRHRQLVIAVLENWWRKYASTLQTIECERESAMGRLGSFLRDLGYG
jgi:type I restriction enzyme M protein